LLQNNLFRRFGVLKKIGSKQLIPIVTAIVGIVFAYIGITQLGFWDKEPKPGFFPSIIAIVMVVASVAAFFQSLKEEGQPNYNKNELMVIGGGLALIIGTFLVGLIPMVFLYILFWLKVVEKGTPWKHIIIIEVIVGVIVIGVFVCWLQVQFPWGLLEMFM
jgi:peptidoglycan biosynthesis protein MviN/MurJ (putative lipid II flippase)